MIFIIIAIIILLISLYLLYQAKKIKVQRTNQTNQIKKQLQEQQRQLSLLQNDISNSKQQLNILHDEKNKLDIELQTKKKNINNYYDTLTSQALLGFQSYEDNLEKYYQKKEKDFIFQIQKIQSAQVQAQNELAQIRNTIQAATAAHLRQQEDQTKWAFYRIQLSDQQATDISYLQEWKIKLYNPSIVSKIIWSSYVMKPTTDMCNRVLGTTKPVCGIYKITDKTTGKSYIGQSVNIADRWKSHVKCGLGIDAPSTNKLYNCMQETGVWNFTFEVLQECSRDKLNEKERFWIDMYQSNKVGLNSTKGINK